MGSLVVSLCLTLVGTYGQAWRSIDSCTYATDADVRSNWTAYAGALPAKASDHGITLPLKMVGETPRAFWDRKVTGDLRRFDRFTFDFFVEDPDQVSSTFNLYFESGAGWYTSSFTAEKGWNHVSISKAQFSVEGRPEGWAKIKTLRIGAWKSVDGSTTLAMADIKAVSSPVAVVLGDRTPPESPEFGTVVVQSQVLTKVLGDAGILAGGLTDTDVESGALEGRQIAVFPHNPNMSEKEMDEVEKFVKAGGRVMGFYSVHPRLLKLIGIELVTWKPQEFPGQYATITFDRAKLPGIPDAVRQASWNANVVRPVTNGAKVLGTWTSADGKSTSVPAVVLSDTGAYMSHVLLADDPEGKRQMMLALLGRFAPSIWSQACDDAKRIVGHVGSFTTYEAATAQLGVAATVEAKRLYDAAETLLGAGRLPEALHAYQASHRALVKAYCAAQSPKAGEYRAVWCHSAFGVPGLSWDTVTKRLADGGIDMVFPNMLWGGLAYYPSKVLPVDPSVKTQGDQIESCLAAARKNGVQVHVWKVNWNLTNAPKEFVSQMRSAQRTQKDPEGHDLDWLCPSDPRNLEMERDSMLEVVKNYAVDGVHFDYIRYPGGQGCYCDSCRKRFEEQFAVHVVKWPQDVLTGPNKSDYLEFRRRNITRLVKEVSTAARKVRPGVKVSAAVFADWPLCRDSVGQDWVAWLKEGYLDFACPMAYTGSAAQYQQWLAVQKTALGSAPNLCPGVGVTLDTLMPGDQVVRQILVGRQAGSRGFILFNLNRALLDETLPLLRLGLSTNPEH